MLCTRGFWACKLWIHTRGFNSSSGSHWLSKACQLGRLEVCELEKRFSPALASMR